jgi:hypothetical protein
VSAKDATIVIPANAFSSDIKVTVEKVTNTSSLPIAENSKLVSDVFEIKKDKSGDFTKPVTITLPFDKSKVDTDKYGISIFWLNEETNKWIELDDVKVEADKVSGTVNHFTKFAVLATEKAEGKPEQQEIPNANFPDTQGHWAQQQINKLVSMGAIHGYPDGTFKPNKNITRAEFSTILVTAFNLTPQSGKVFKDTAQHWAKDAIATAASYGIVNGYSVDKFGPDDVITREQMAVMIVNALKLSESANSKVFKDQASISKWALGSVQTAVESKIMNGYPDNTIKPKGKATRAEAVTVIVNALNK